jgi:DsbC/DsbD-like thiol-disulfide interchange protein
MAHGARDGNVGELARGEHASKHESAAAHVAASDEVGRKAQAAVQPALDHVDVFSGRDAPEQDRGVVTGERGGERGGVAFEGLAEPRLAGGDADLRNLAEVLEADDRVGGNEPAAGRDYQDTVGDRPCACESAPVRELASEVETAQEGEDLAQRRPALAELNSERERGLLPKQDLGAPPAAVRRGEQEDGLGGRLVQPLRVVTFHLLIIIHSMTHPRPAIVPVLLLGLLAPLAVRADPESPKTRVDLISESRTVTPGQPLYVGLRVRMAPGWHTYWKNPGDSGLPVRMAWDLPPGFNAGRIEWPAPDRFAESDLMTYGYHDEVVFPVRIWSPAAIEGDSVRISGTVDWLECRDVCVAGTSPVALTLGVSRKSSSPGPDAGAMTAARSRVPAPPQGWTMNAEAGPRAIALAFHPPKDLSVRAAYLYVDQPLVVEHAKPQGLEAAGGGYRLTMTPALNAIRNPARLTGVLLVEGGGLFRRRTAVQVDVPVAKGDPAPAPVSPTKQETPNAGVVAALVVLAIGASVLFRNRKRQSQHT